MTGGFIYKILFVIVRVAMFFYHPVFRVVGRENIPRQGRFLICPNHRGMADPVWVIFALRLGHIPRIMAKIEVMKVPVLGWFLRKMGVFGVNRDGADITAIKTGLRCLKDDQQLMLFPEGTRVKPGQHVAPKAGAILLAHRTDSPILPVYLTTRRYPFSPMTCVIGKPYEPDFGGCAPTEEQLQREANRLMDQIYEMGERA